MKPQDSDRLSVIELLRTSKALEPISDSVRRELERIQTLDVSSYSEADVRAEVIDPVVRALGYQKQTSFSVVREKHLKIGDGNVFADFSLTLWEEDFWVIEAKRVKREAPRFVKDEIQQALMYASHPDINAALMVLCDGRMFHVYDRERDLEEPVVKVEVSNLVRDFDQLRALLSPWQTWFFQKRRILHLVDKVFDREVTLQRLEDFRNVVDRRLANKRQAVLENQRALAAANPDERVERLKNFPNADLIDGHLMWPLSRPDIHVIGETLVGRFAGNDFPILHRLFPDEPKPATSSYWGHALYFLMKLEETHQEIGWLPSYLASASRTRPLNVSDAVKRLLEYCLTCFHRDMPHRLCQLYSAGARRIAKQLVVTLPQTAALGRQSHAVAMHLLDEIDLSRFFSSSEGHTIGLIDRLQVDVLDRFIALCKQRGHGFDIATATQNLRDLWATERALLGDGERYRVACNGRNLGEVFPTEADCVLHDFMGHLTLCIVGDFPKWKEYVLENHFPEVQTLVQLGSHAARTLLGMEVDAPAASPNLSQVADRFFLGDIGTLTALAKGYGMMA